jgi:hypothetical protein
MSHCVISAKYPPQIDITKTPLAYGNGALPRLVFFLLLLPISSFYDEIYFCILKNVELMDMEKLVTRQRALRSLCDYLHDPEHISTAISIGRKHYQL